MRFLDAAILLALLVAPLSAPPAAATSARTVSAIVACADDASGVRQLQIDITNRTSAVLHVAFVRPLIGPVSVTEAELDVDDGQTTRVALTSDPTRTSYEVALVVTSAGVLQPSCGGPAATLDLGPRPSTEHEAKVESAAIAARTLSILEGLRAYDAIYALLHPDAKALAPYKAVACWYDQQLATRRTAEATVNSVRFGSWTWGANGVDYPDAAEIVYTQPYWVDGVREDRTGTEHLVPANGQWRWFFGNDRAWIDQLPTTCEVSGLAAPTVPVPGTVDLCRWLGETVDRLARAQQMRGEIQDALDRQVILDLTLLASQHYQEFAQLADAQRQSHPPLAVAAINELLVNGYDALSRGLSYLMTVGFNAWIGALSADDEDLVRRAGEQIALGDTWINDAINRLAQLDLRCD